MRIVKIVLALTLIVANATLFNAAFLSNAKTFAQDGCDKTCGYSLGSGGSDSHRTCSGAGPDSCHVTSCPLLIPDCGYQDSNNDVCAGNPGGNGCENAWAHGCR